MTSAFFMLYIVATPIGNLEDITLRAVRILKDADYILCEDTRVTKKLLDCYKIENRKLISYHQHTNERKVQQILEFVKDNKVALVTDAGTPGISDPGNKLINYLVGAIPASSAGRHELPLKIAPIPGACALIAALSISGLPTDKFIFKGFVPHKKAREKFLCEVLEAKETVVFYESCHRIIKTLLSICHSEERSEASDEESRVFKTDGIPPHPQMRACRNDNPHRKHFVVCRELTKKFETIYRGTANEVLEQIKKDFPGGNPKGEFVVVVS